MNNTNIPLNPDLTMAKAQELLDQGDADMAMVYFYQASEAFVKVGNWEKAGDSRFKAAYCYHIDGRTQKASEDYEMAASFYRKANILQKAIEARLIANALKIRDLVKNLDTKKPLVIGVVGLNGSGKDVVVIRLKEKYNVPSVSTGDITRDIAKEEGIEPTRENLHEISQRYWAMYGREYYPRRIARKIEENHWVFAGVTGIRPPSDVNILREFFRSNFLLVYVEVTDPKVRFNRLMKRSEARDPKEYESFISQEASEEEIFHLSETISMRNVTFNNDGPIENLFLEIDGFAMELGLAPG